MNPLGWGYLAKANGVLFYSGHISAIERMWH